MSANSLRLCRNVARERERGMPIEVAGSFSLTVVANTYLSLSC